MTIKKKEKTTSQPTPKKEMGKHEIFLRSLAEYGNVTSAARTADLDRSTLYRKRRDNEIFASSWDDALAIGTAALEDEAKRRGYEGWLEPIYHKGEECGVVRKYSDTLLITLLNAHYPERYRKNLTVSGDLNFSALEKGRDRAKERL